MKLELSRSFLFVLAISLLAALAFGQTTAQKTTAKGPKVLNVTETVNYLSKEVQSLKQKVGALETRLAAVESKNASQDTEIAKKANAVNPEGYSGMWCNKNVFEGLDKFKTLIHVYYQD